MFGKGLGRALNVKGGCGIKPQVSLLWKMDWHFTTDQLILLLPVHALFIIIIIDFFSTTGNFQDADVLLYR